MSSAPLPTSSAAPAPSRARPQHIGAEVIDPAHVEFRVWAPAAEQLEVVVNGRTVTLSPEGEGYFSGQVEARAGDRYGYRVNASDRLFPDPASRFQPDGPHGLSEIIDPTAFEWSDADWKGVSLPGQIVYELHIGTFTRAGTWAAAERELPELADCGITIIEMMPIAEFDGAFGWGYDGVDLFAPSHLYGRPDDLRRFINRAHALGIGVILDVVYNHLGPAGNYLRVFSPGYFTDRYENEWGDAINFDGYDAAPVRHFFMANAGYWIDEFHFDGLRLDATQQIFDHSTRNVMTMIGERVREAAAGRATIVIAENEPQDSKLVRPVAQDGYGLDALWNDDFHHSAMVALTGRAEAYYSDTAGDPQEFISAAKYGYLFQGQYYHWQRKRRGTASLDIPPWRYVNFLQNHDQVANSARGLRGHQMTSPGRWRAMTALLLLLPGTPMLFQGQEFSASSPFLYFANFDGELSDAVRKGRSEFLQQFPSVAAYEEVRELDDPGDLQTFTRSKLDFAEREINAGPYALHRDLIRLRRENAAFTPQRAGGVDGAVLGDRAFALRYFGNAPAEERLLIVNFGPDLNRSSFAEPLIAPPFGRDWYVQWSSEDARYGGAGLADVWRQGRWCIPAECTIVMAPDAERPLPPSKVRRRTA